MKLQLAYHLIRHPRGIEEDMLFKVDKYIFLEDFVVLDEDVEVEVPLYLDDPSCVHQKLSLISMVGK